MQFKNKNPHMIVISLFIFSILGSFLFLKKISDDVDNNLNISKKKCKTVKEIGGCDSNYCGVKFNDGSYSDYASRPVVGAIMCGMKINDTELYFIK